MSSEKFCLRWNDFERNISSAFKDIREDKEFFDITIACEEEQLQAHKVILSACSPFFKNVLRRNQHQHPLLYLKGVSYRDMEAVLNFMYHGEVNVAQDDLNSFLQVAEDLRVKGIFVSQENLCGKYCYILDLTQNSSGNAIDSSKSQAPPVPKAEPRIEPLRPSNPDLTTPTPKRPRPAPTVSRTIPQSLSQQDDIQEIVPVVKSEPRDPTPTVMATTIPHQVEQQQSMAMYNEGSQQMGDSMMMTMDSEQYDDSYGGEYEGHYEDQAYDTSMVAAGQDTSGAGENNTVGIDALIAICVLQFF